MAQFCTITRMVEADQWFPGKIVPGVCNCPSDECGRASHVHTAHGRQAVRLEKGDWVLAEPDGKGYYPVKPDIFAARYVPAPPDSGTTATP